jgi:diguanylate cyclase (GGDEF)-like protein
MKRSSLHTLLAFALMCMAPAQVVHAVQAASAPHLAAQSTAAQSTVATVASDARDARDALDALRRSLTTDPATAATHLATLTALTESGSNSHRALAAWHLVNAHHHFCDDAAAAALVWRLERSSSGLDRTVAALARGQAAAASLAPDLAVRETREALQRLDSALASAMANASPGVLEETLRTEVFRLLGAATSATGQVDEGLRHLQTSRRLAQALRDPAREALALNEEADVLAQYGLADRALAAQNEAWRAALTAAPHNTALQAHMLVSVAKRSLLMAPDPAGLAAAKAAAQSALLLARTAKASALEAESLLLMSRTARLDGEPAAAQRTARAAHSAVQGLPTTAPLKRMALVEQGLALIASGQVTQGQQMVEAVLQRQAGAGAVTGAGADPLAAVALRELDKALRAAGEPHAALAIFHRERALQQARLEQERAVVLRDLQTRHDRERQERELQTLNRGNTLKATALEQREQMQRGLWAAAVLVAVGLGLMVVLYQRLHSLRSRLAASQAKLKNVSEHDALTGLANRRHCHAVVTQGGMQTAFEGGLLLLDIDHFKRINDQHGHAAGDAVLVEVSRRLSQTVRADDLVVRWGGEEFVVLALSLPADRLPWLAERLREAIASVPIDSPAGPLRVTISIGHAHFPLAQDTALAWERAIDLVDGALYTAKAAGRDCARAVVSGGQKGVERAAESGAEAPAPSRAQPALATAA